MTRERKGRWAADGRLRLLCGHLERRQPTAAQAAGRLGRVGGVPGVSVAHGFFAGGGHFDEITFPTKGSAGATVRIFNPARQEWSIYWMSSDSGELGLPPMVGRFVDGVGHFYADDQHEGRPVRCRFIWSDISATTARWEQAFSVDGEQTWETNWIMTFTKAS
ncbi:hypothetical protein NKG94_13030 [Micromonospora sp. M12]